MKATFPTARLGELCRISYGKGLPKDQRIAGDYPVMGSNGPVDFHDQAITKAPCIVIGRKGSIGEIAFLRTPCWPIDTAYYIDETDARLDIEYLSFILGAAGLKTKNKAGAIPSLLRPDLEAVDVQLPPIFEQRRIVARIKECMERVEEIARLHAQTVKEREALLESVIEAEFQDSNGNAVALSEICTIKSTLVDPTQAPFLDAMHVGGANIESSTGRLLNLRMAREEKLKSSKFPFDQTMVLYNKIRPYLKKVARPAFEGICSADMYPLVPNKKRLSRDYLFFVLLSRHFTLYAIEGSNRAGMPKVNRDHLFKYRFPLPKLARQKQIADRLNEAFEILLSLRSDFDSNQQSLSHLRDAILRKAFAKGP
jgi:type I restriction enzyme S subunit